MRTMSACCLRDSLKLSEETMEWVTTTIVRLQSAGGKRQLRPVCGKGVDLAAWIFKVCGNRCRFDANITNAKSGYRDRGAQSCEKIMVPKRFLERCKRWFASAMPGSDVLHLIGVVQRRNNFLD